MAVVIAKSAAALAKALIRRNVAGVIATSTKGMLSQVRIYLFIYFACFLVTNTAVWRFRCMFKNDIGIKILMKY